MFYAKFFKENGEAVGSDGYMLLNGRWGYDRAYRAACLEGVSRNLKLGESFVAFQLRKGTLYKYWNASRICRLVDEPGVAH
jgi:hypothetical protein